MTCAERDRQYLGKTLIVRRAHLTDDPFDVTA